MVDGRWDATGDGQRSGDPFGGQRDTGSEFTSAGTPFGASSSASGSSPFTDSASASSSPFADSPFDGTDEPAPWLGEGGSSPISTTAPVTWLWLACAAAAAGLLLALLTDQFSWHLAGWVLAGPLALGLLALFTLKDTARRANPWYLVHAVAPWLYRVAVVAALVGVVVCALRIALYVGRL